MYSSLIRPRLSFLFSLPLSRPTIATLEIAVYCIHTREVGSAQRKTVSPHSPVTHPRRIRRRRISRHSRTYGHAREHVNGTCHRWFFESHLSTKAARLFSLLLGRPFSPNLYLSTYVPLRDGTPAAADDDGDDQENWNYLTRACVHGRQTAAVRHAADTEPGVCKRALA